MSQGGTTVTAQAQSGALAQLELDPSALAELDRAMTRLRGGRGVLVRVADLLGGAVGRFTWLGAARAGMPDELAAKFRGLAAAALARALDVSVLGLADKRAAEVSRRAAQPVVLASGVVGGFLGLSGFLPDITLTTLVLMREIARIAAEEGEDPTEETTKRACLEVFAFRAGETGTEDSELGYFTARLLLQGRPMVLLLSEVSARYGVALGRRFALQAVPVAGAITGAAMNAAFLDYYRQIARAHFTVRRLERRYGDKVREAAAMLRHAPAR